MSRNREYGLSATAVGTAVGSHYAAPHLTAGRRLGAVRPASIRFNGRLAGGALLGAAGASAMGADDRQVAGGLAGAAAGQAAHQAPGYAHSWFLRNRTRDRSKDYMNQSIKRADLPQEQKKLRDKWEKKERGPWLKAHPDPTDRYRNYPKHWPNARAERFKAHWAGGTKGKVINAALVAGGGVAGYRAMQRRGVRKAMDMPKAALINMRFPRSGSGAKAMPGGKMRGMQRVEVTPYGEPGPVLRYPRGEYTPMTDRRITNNYKMQVRGGKSSTRLKYAGPPGTTKAVEDPRSGSRIIGKSVQFGYRERSVSPVRAGEAAVGIAALAWGGSRLKMLGPLAQHGVKAASRHGLEQEARRAVGYGAKAGASTRAATGRGEKVLRDKISGFGTSLDRIPAKMQPGVVAGAGAAVTAHAVPVRRERFVPTRRY